MQANACNNHLKFWGIKGIQDTSSRYQTHFFNLKNRSIAYLASISKTVVFWGVFFRIFLGKKSVPPPCFWLVFNFLKTHFLDFFLSNIFLISLKRNVENGFSIIEHFNLFEMGFLASICSVLPDLNFFWRWVHIWYQKLLIGTLALMVNIEEWVARNQ